VRGEPIPPSLVDLLKRMLELDPDQRITPRELLKHPFICQESQDQPSSSSAVQPPSPSEASSSSSSSAVQPLSPCEASSSSSSEFGYAHFLGLAYRFIVFSSRLLDYLSCDL